MATAHPKSGKPAREAAAVALAEERARRWKEDNREAIEGWNRYVETHGLPLEDYRTF